MNFEVPSPAVPRCRWGHVHLIFKVKKRLLQYNIHMQIFKYIISPTNILSQFVKGYCVIIRSDESSSYYHALHALTAERTCFSSKIFLAQQVSVQGVLSIFFVAKKLPAQNILANIFISKICFKPKKTCFNLRKSL